MEEKTLPELSKDTKNRLTDLRKSDPSLFYQHIYSLRRNNWPLRAIAAALGVSRTAVSAWETKADPYGDVPATESLPTSLPTSLNSTYRNEDLSTEESAELLKLAQSASRVRRYTSTQSDARQDADALETLLVQYNDAGVSITKLAKACGVTRRAIAQRLEKHK